MYNMLNMYVFHHYHLTAFCSLEAYYKIIVYFYVIHMITLGWRKTSTLSEKNWNYYYSMELK